MRKIRKILDSFIFYISMLRPLYIYIYLLLIKTNFILDSPNTVVLLVLNINLDQINI